MFISKPVYFIMWRERPTQFIDADNSPTDYFEDADMFYDKKEVEDTIKTFDDPDLFEIVEGKIEVEI